MQTTNRSCYRETDHGMADFSDLEDHYLVQLALRFEASGNPISWVEIARSMPRWRNHKNKLKFRLKALKKRFGRNLSGFPPRYLLPRAMSASLREHAEPHPFQDITEAYEYSELQQRYVNILRHRACRTDAQLPEERCCEIMSTMYSHVTRSHVRQVSKRVESNMGEISINGVTKIIRACHLTNDDIFLDVGAGIGNVAVQVALQTRVREALGIELRTEIVSLSRAAIAQHTGIHHQLARVTLLDGDIRDLQPQAAEDIGRSTVLYSFNEVFEIDSVNELEALCCTLPHLRLVIVSRKFCPRQEHPKTCSNEFCSLWERRSEVTVNVTFKSSPVLFTIYERGRV